MTELNFALTGAVHEQMRALLLRNAPEEEVCFALIAPSTGHRRRTLIVREVLEPRPGERAIHGNVSFSAPFVDRCIDAAIDAGLGLMLLHSHPFGRGFQRPSRDDLRAERRTLETATFAMPGRAVASAIMSGDGVLSGREYCFDEPGGSPSVKESSATRIVGPHLVVQRDATTPRIADEHASHVGMFGELGQATLASLSAGIVGMGSVGWVVNMELARLGLGRIGGLDYDRVERRNANRLDVRPSDIRLRRLKVEVGRRQALLAATAPAFHFDAHVGSIVEDAGVRRMLDYDLLFSCADSHWSRQVLNALSYAHLIPVIDGGTGINADGETFQTASFRVQPAGPGRGCLACGGAFDPSEIGEEMSGIVAPHYAGRAAKHVGAPSVMPLNAALASFEVMRFMEIALGIANERVLPRQRFDYRGGDVDLEVIRCVPGCPWAAAEGFGDAAVLPTGVDLRFAAARRAPRSGLADPTGAVTLPNGASP